MSSGLLFLPFVLTIIGFGLTAILYYYRAQIAAHVPSLGWTEHVSFKKIGMGIGLLMLVLFWGPIADWLTVFLFASDAGKATGIAENEGAQSFIRTWFWLVPIVGLWFWLRSNRGEKPKKIGGSTFGDNVALVLMGVPFLAVCALVVVIAGFIAMGIGDAATDGKVNKVFMQTVALATGQEYEDPTVVVSENCATRESLENVTFSQRGTAALICPQGGQVLIFAQYGQTLHYNFNEAWYRENQQVLNGRALADLVKLYTPHTFPGSIASSYMLEPQYEEIWNAGFRDGIPIVIYGTE